MPRFKIFNPATGKDESLSQREIDQRTKKSAQWFRDSLNDQFGKPKTRAAQKAQRDLETAEHRKTKQSEKGKRDANRFANSNTTLDGDFKRNLRTITGNPEIGRLYMYVYDPKHKKTLPYYDVFPMVFIMDLYDDGFLGMNMHYLPYLLRARLMEELLKHMKSTRRKGKPEKYLDISYTILKAAGANKYFNPTIKRYLTGHIRSPLAEVLEPEWENAIFLPVEQFRKKNKREVWADSRGETS